MIESKRSESIAKLGAALAVAQGQIKTAKKDNIAKVKTKKGADFTYKYSTLDDIWEVSRKPLSDNGLSIIQIPINDETGFYLETILIHSSGEWISGRMTLPVVADRMSQLQAMGSAITYARRYALGAMVGVTTGDDDDGQQASSRQKFEATPEWQTPPVQPFPDNNPTLAEFTRKVKDAGFEPTDAAEVLKTAGFNGYDPGKASQMWEVIIAEYEARKAAQSLEFNESIPQVEQTAMDEVEAIAG